MSMDLGFRVPKPIVAPAECECYMAMAAAINTRNAACLPGDILWSIEDKGDFYEIVEVGVFTEPDSAKTVEEQLTELQAALEDADALNVDQEYRLTLLELGITDFE